MILFCRSTALFPLFYTFDIYILQAAIWVCVTCVRRPLPHRQPVGAPDTGHGLDSHAMIIFDVFRVFLDSVL